MRYMRSKSKTGRYNKEFIFNNISRIFLTEQEYLKIKSKMECSEMVKK